MTIDSLLDAVGVLTGDGKCPEVDAFLRSLADPNRMGGVTFSRVSDFEELERLVREAVATHGNVVGGEELVYRLMIIERATDPNPVPGIDEAASEPVHPDVRRMWWEAAIELIRARRAHKHVAFLELPIRVDRPTLINRVDAVIDRIVMRDLPGEIEAVVVISCPLPRQPS